MLLDLALYGAMFVGGCAFMGTSFKGGWIIGTLKAAGMMTLTIGVVQLISWVLTPPGQSMWGN